MIEHLFSKGRNFSAFPVKVLYDEAVEQDTPLKIGVTVSSRTFKKAVDRNRIKRVMRECCRLQKKTLQQQLTDKEKKRALFFIYTGKTLPDYGVVFEKIGLLLQRLSGELLKQASSV